MQSEHQDSCLRLWVGMGGKRRVRSTCADCHRDRVTLVSFGVFFESSRPMGESACGESQGN